MYGHEDRCPYPAHPCICTNVPLDRERNEMVRRFNEWAGPALVVRGCICPPASEQTCMNPLCPRKGPPSF